MVAGFAALLSAEAACHLPILCLLCPWFWKGGESLPARVGGGKSEHQWARCRVTSKAFGDTRGRRRREASRRTVPQKTDRPFGISNFKFEISVGARVKRWGKSPPLETQVTRHGKPHRVQGQIGDHGAARSKSRHRATGSGYRPLRQMILSPACCLGPGRQNSAYSPSKITFGSRERAAGSSKARKRPTAIRTQFHGWFGATGCLTKASFIRWAAARLE